MCVHSYHCSAKNRAHASAKSKYVWTEPWTIQMVKITEQSNAMIHQLRKRKLALFNPGVNIMPAQYRRRAMCILLFRVLFRYHYDLHQTTIDIERNSVPVGEKFVLFRKPIVGKYFVMICKTSVQKGSALCSMNIFFSSLFSSHRRWRGSCRSGRCKSEVWTFLAWTFLSFRVIGMLSDGKFTLPSTFTLCSLGFCLTSRDIIYSFVNALQWFSWGACVQRFCF